MKSKLLLVFLIAAHGLFSQISRPPASDPIYNSSEVTRIDITIDSEHLEQILAEENESSDVEYPADFSFTSSTFSADEQQIGFRLRGNTSRSSAKKSFKVAFNSFEPGRDLEGYEKLNLNGEHNDPSIARSKLCWDLMQQVGVPASRAAHTTLYINGEYRGLYINVEHIDEEFVELRFGNKTGNLYKCLYPADLNYLGSNPDQYKNESGSRRMYELKTNEEADDYSGLAHFIQVLNQTNAAEFQEKIEEVFDVNSYLKALAVEMLTAHWDNYGVNKNNFYLYHNPEDDKFYYIPYDMDNTLGIDFIGDGWTDTDIYEWYDDRANRPLTRRMMENDIFRSRFSTYVDEILRDHFNPEALFPEIDRIQAMITEYAEADAYKAMDYGFTNADFHASFTDDLSYGFVKEGLKPFVSKRYQSAMDQLVLSASVPLSLEAYPNPFAGSIRISLPENAFMVTVYTLNGVVVHAARTLQPEYTWDGRDEQGTPLSNGIYLLEVRGESYQGREKIVLRR